MVEGNALRLRPLGQGVGDELGTVVQANGQRCAPNFDQFIQGTDDPRRWQAGVDLNAQALPVVFVDDVERPEAPPRPQGVRHEVATPALVGLIASLQRLFDARRQPFLASAGQVEPQLAVHPPQHRLTPRLFLVAGAVVEQIKAMAWIDCHVALDEGDHPGVVAWYRPVTQC